MFFLVGIDRARIHLSKVVTASRGPQLERFQGDFTQAQISRLSMHESREREQRRNSLLCKIIGPTVALLTRLPHLVSPTLVVIATCGLSRRERIVVSAEVPGVKNALFAAMSMEETMSKITLAVLISLVAGFAVGAWMTDGDDVEQTDGVASVDNLRPLEERLLSLEQLLADERDARLELEGRLQDLIDATNRDAVPVAADEADRARESQATSVASPRRSRDFGSMMRNFEERRLSRLMDGGFSEDEARRILRKESEAEYRAMQAAWEAQRSGERVDPLASLNSPQAILRAELGDSDYERLLQAQGQPTSVQVTRVLDGSPGNEAGLQPGDQLISYDGNRVFSVADLRDQTMRGEPGEDVLIEIDRDGVRMQLSVPRGPVGITGSGANIRTMSRWGGG